MEDIIIVGSGPSGLTAAIYLARAGYKPLVIDGSPPGTHAITAAQQLPIEGLESDPIAAMRHQASRYGARFISGTVEQARLQQQPFILTLSSGEIISARSLIISTGASAKYMGIPGERENAGHSVSHASTRDGFFVQGRKLIEIDGNESATEEAIFFTPFASEARLIHRRMEHRTRQLMQERARANPNIKWTMDVRPIEVIPGEIGLHGLKVAVNTTGVDQLLDPDGILVAHGPAANCPLGWEPERDDQGRIKVVPGTSATSIPGVFACGDVQDRLSSEGIDAAGSGCIAALDCEHFLAALSPAA